MVSSDSDPTRDWIFVNDLSIRTAVGASLWAKPGAETKSQPVLISLAVPFSVKLAGASDQLPHSIHYGILSKTAEQACVKKKSFACMEEMAEETASASLEAFDVMEEIRVTVEKPRALLQAESVSIIIERGKGSTTMNADRVVVKNLELSTIIGIHPWERENKQRVRVNLTLDVPRWSPADSEGFDYVKAVGHISEHILASSYQTVEALATSIAEETLTTSSAVSSVTVRVAKPSALMFAESPEIQITRTRADLSPPPPTTDKIIAIAFGSNIGDRFANIEKALDTLEREGVKIVDTSFLYESSAMYVEDQRNFINGACLISTTLEPEPLLDLLKSIEAEVGRTPTFRNGPRVVDLDLIFYDHLAYESEAVGTDGMKKLIVPHVRVHEREFVLRPLADMIPHFVHPTLRVSIVSLLDRLPKGGLPLKRVIPFTRPQPRSPHSECRYWTWGEKTRIMAVINTTPDSFSDGGDHLETEKAMNFVQSFILPSSTTSMVDIIDVGGYSTRPGAQPVSPEEEIRRTVSVIKAIRSSSNPSTRSTLISIDTFRGSVAQAALDAGADIVNDVYGLTADSSILNVVQKSKCPVILMHSRGDAGQDKEYPAGVMQGVRDELAVKVKRALDNGVRRWNIIVDPGIGFSKTVEGNLDLIRNLRDFTAPQSQSHPLESMPVLVGASRKSFLGQLIEREATSKARLAATLAIHSAGIQQGADIIRVHDVVEAWDMVKVADALWRS